MIKGSDLREARLRRGIGVKRLGQLIGRDPGHLSRVERGERNVTPALIRDYQQALGPIVAATEGPDEQPQLGDTVEVASGPSTPTSGHNLSASVAITNHANERNGEVRRRRFVQALTSIAVSATAPAMALEALRQSIRHSVASDGDQWNDLLASYGADFYTTPADELSRQLAVDLGVLGQLMAIEPDDPDLERAAAGLSMILAITLTSVGKVWNARRWWDTARRAADKSGDQAMRVMTRSQDAVKGLYDGRPLSEALRLADQTIALAGLRICPGTAGVLAGRAQALAIAGRHEEAIVAVRAVEAITEHMPQVHLGDETMFGWPEHRLRHTQSFVFTEVGLTARAMQAEDRALDLYPEAHAGNRAMVQMHRASCLIQDGHIADGLRYAADVLDGLSLEHHDVLLYEVARRMLASVPGLERRRPDAAALADRVAALPAR